MIAPSRESTIGVIPVFWPEGNIKARIERLSKQVSATIIIANDGQSIHELGLDKIENLIHIQPGKNIGLAAAINAGLSKANSLKAAWCILLDQDTTVDVDLIDKMGGIYQKHRSKKRIGILAVNYRSVCKSRLAYSNVEDGHSLETCITSGSIISTEMVNNIGVMKEELFIEGVDVEFCLRAKENGYIIVTSKQPYMTHSAGYPETKRFLWRKVEVTHHTPWRCYMQYKNMTSISAEYAFKKPVWVTKTWISLVKRMMLILTFEKNKIAKLASIMRGIYAGYETSVKSRRVKTKPREL